jgi:alpha-ribazole phosphatase
MVLKNPNQYERGKTIVYFVRHGDRIHIPDCNGIGMKIPGPGLSEKGKKQAKEVAKKFIKIKTEIDRFYCSRMARAIETAEEIGKKIKKKPIIWPGIEEFNSLLFERKIYHPKFWKHYFLQKKALCAFNNLLEKNKGKVIVIVAHGNVIKSLIFRKMGLSLKKTGMFHHMNCYISVARYKNKKLDHICCYNSNSLNHSDLKI